MFFPTHQNFHDFSRNWYTFCRFQLFFLSRLNFDFPEPPDFPRFFTKLIHFFAFYLVFPIYVEFRVVRLSRFSTIFPEIDTLFRAFCLFFLYMLNHEISDTPDFPRFFPKLAHFFTISLVFPLHFKFCFFRPTRISTIFPEIGTLFVDFNCFSFLG